MHLYTLVLFLSSVFQLFGRAAISKNVTLLHLIIFFCVRQVSGNVEGLQLYSACGWYGAAGSEQRELLLIVNF